MTVEVDHDDVRRYLDKVVESGVFDRKSMRFRLLEHLLQTKLAGKEDSLKAYSIGLDVFGKSPDFDPTIDSSVRVAMGRLRTALALFESSDFASSELVVHIPVGTYQPQLSHRDRSEHSQPPKTSLSYVRILAGVCMFLLAGFLLLNGLPFLDPADIDNSVALEVDTFTGDEDLATQVAAALRRSLSRSGAIEVISQTNAGEYAAETDLVLKGDVTRTEAGLARVTLELSSLASQSIVWAKVQDFDDDALLQDRVSQVLGSELRIRAFGASKQELATRDPQTLSPEQLFVMATWVPGAAVNAAEWELGRVALMRVALEKDPDFGSAHSVMADKLAYLANVYSPSNTTALREAALSHAQTALELSPLSPDVMFNVAQALWHSGQIHASEGAMKRVLDLDAGHDVARFLSKMIPYTCEAPPDDVLAWAITFDQDLSPDNPIRWLTLTWIAWLHANLQDYEKALIAEEQAALIFEIPYTFMRHAMLLNKLDRIDEAATIIASQRKNWPDIDPDHFANVTIPRLCSESDDTIGRVKNYQDLALALRNNG